jgi:hypothetical protein
MLGYSTVSDVLLQVLLFHRHACEALDEDALLELADWAVRKLAHLNSGAAHAYANAPGGCAFALLRDPSFRNLMTSTHHERSHSNACSKREQQEPPAAAFLQPQAAVFSQAQHAA